MAFVCTSCDHRSPRWMGFCPRCGSDEALREVAEPTAGPGRRSKRRRVDPPTVVALTEVAEPPGARAVDGPMAGRVDEPVEERTHTRVAGGVGRRRERLRSGVAEVDEVLGGGIVPGAAVLLGGEPGVGKSTLVLQVAAGIAAAGRRVLVVSAEESVPQVAMRARRLGIDDGVRVAAEADVDRIVAAAQTEAPEVLVVDSIQTVGCSDVVGAPGGVAQVRESAARLVRMAKDVGVATVLIGHVTKDGGIAGPKLLEHMVDVVLYLEGDPDHGVRLLRALKNRFGSTHPVGIFEMTETGLRAVADPSANLLTGWNGKAPGSILLPTMEGRRPVVVEVQALVAPSAGPHPRRSVRGLEIARLHQLLAVLHRHAGLDLSGQDVYAAVVGGLKVREPAADLAVALALASSFADVPLGSTAAWGEVGLTGEVRPVGHARRRREEVARLGVARVVAPEGSDMRLVEALAASRVFGTAGAGG